MIRVLLLVLSLSGCSDDVVFTETCDVVNIGGSLRQSNINPSEWYFISDDEHQPIGVDSSVVSIANDNFIQLEYGRSYSKVISIVVGPDETYARELDLVTGASVGLEFSRIEISSNGAKLNPSEYLGHPKGNIWFTGFMQDCYLSAQ